jgi:hypothetical protein
MPLERCPAGRQDRIKTDVSSRYAALILSLSHKCEKGCALARYIAAYY